MPLCFSAFLWDGFDGKKEREIWFTSVCLVIWSSSSSKAAKWSRTKLFSFALLFWFRLFTRNSPRLQSNYFKLNWLNIYLSWPINFIVLKKFTLFFAHFYFQIKGKSEMLLKSFSSGGCVCWSARSEDLKRWIEGNKIIYKWFSWPWASQRASSFVWTGCIDRGCSSTHLASSVNHTI